MMYLETRKFLAALLPGERARRYCKGQSEGVPFQTIVAVRFPPDPVTRATLGHVTFAGLPEQDYLIHTQFELETPYERLKYNPVTNNLQPSAFLLP